MTVKVTVNWVANGGSITVTVFEDTDQDGTAENQETVSLSGGTETFTLQNLDGNTGNDYWLKVDASSGNTNTPTLDSATLDIPQTVIAAQVATFTAAGQNPSVDPGGASITAQAATLSAVAQNAGIDPGAASITATVGVLDAAGQNSTVSPGTASIQADAGVLQITAENVARGSIPPRFRELLPSMDRLWKVPPSTASMIRTGTSLKKPPRIRTGITGFGWTLAICITWWCSMKMIRGTSITMNRNRS